MSFSERDPGAVVARVKSTVPVSAIGAIAGPTGVFAAVLVDCGADARRGVVVGVVAEVVLGD